jgi:hypothetical protein
MTIVALVLLLLAAGPVAAAPILKFDDPVGPGGIVAWPGAGPITGVDIQFQSIVGLDTPANAGAVLDCVGCLLDFTTGAATATLGGSILVSALPGGSITLTGAISALGLPAGTLLLSGSFTGTPTEVLGPGRDFGLFLGAGDDTKDPTLAEFFGLDPLAFRFGTTSIQSVLGAVDEVTGAFSGAVVNADLNNTSVLVPNPMSLVFLAVGLAMTRVFRRHGEEPELLITPTKGV